MGKWGIAVIWVISLRRVTRCLRLVIKPIIVLLVIAFVIWWATGHWGEKKLDIEQPLFHEEYEPFSHRVGQGPQPILAALSLYSPAREGYGGQVTVRGSRNN